MTNYAYDSVSNLLSVLHQQGTTTLDGASYTYDSAGNRKSKTNLLNNATSNFSYDNIYQLTGVTGINPESYTYDPGRGLGMFSLTLAQATQNPAITFTRESNRTGEEARLSRPLKDLSSHKCGIDDEHITLIQEIRCRFICIAFQKFL